MLKLWHYEEFLSSICSFFSFSGVLEQIITWRWSINFGLGLSPLADLKKQGLDQPFYSHTYHWNSGMVAVAGHSPWLVSEVPESSIPRARIKFSGCLPNIDHLTLFSCIDGEIELY
ncbi:hypothetical protein OUZ56_022218 [Daphnia magna]|uniref:Uncharacterized protein n=1 Tax=Daphnia magna TaxID=35525 RepID=A0ABR0AVQ7_9CRUS|nr:hypothetical protein OUZ56_022218 [Daphnia magna]